MKAKNPEIQLGKPERLEVIKKAAKAYEERRKMGIKKISAEQRNALQNVFQTIDCGLKGNLHNLLLPQNAGKPAPGISAAAENAKNETSRTPTKIFELFLSELLKRKGSEQTTDLGCSVWSSPPVEDIVTDGLWAVMLSLSKKYNLALATEYQVLEQMGPIVDEMLSQAFSISGNMEALADSFEKEVLASVKNNIRSQKEESEILPQNLWQLSAAQFFARQIANYREYLKKAIHDASNLSKANIADRDGQITFVTRLQFSDANEISKLKRCLLFMENPSYQGFGDFKADAKGISVTLDHISQARRDLADIYLLRKLPFRLQNLPSEDDPQHFDKSVDKLNTSISETWVNTQIILAALNADLWKEYVDEKEFIDGIVLTKKLTPEKLLDQTVERFKKRGMRLDETELNELHLLIKSNISAIRSEDFRMEMMEDTFYVTSRFFLALRRDVAPVLSFESVEWKRLSLADLKKMIINEDLTPFMFAKGICLMKEKLQKKAAALLMANSIFIGLEGLILLCEHDLINFDNGVLRKNIDRLPKEWLKKHVFELLENDDSTREDVGTFIRAINLFDVQNAKEILNRPERRSILLNIVFKISSTYDRSAEKLSDREFENFVERIGKDTWQKLLLADQVLMRCDDYGKPIGEEDIELVPWQEMADDQDLQVLMGDINRDELQRIIAANPEDEIFKWVNEGDADLKSRLAKFRKDRADYYVRLAARKR